MSIFIRYTALSDVGLLRQNNQDGGYASQHLLVLADGMGGAAAGDVASSVTVGHLAALDDDVHQADDLLPLLRKAISDAHTDLIERAINDPQLAGLGTTCIAIMRSSNKLAMVHVGDSRAYLFRDDHLTQVTHDHTLVQYLVDHGELTPEEAEYHPKRNVIMRALGDFPGEVELDESVREAIPGDRWLLCSDGLCGYVSDETNENTLRDTTDINECGQQLIELALAAGGPDNVTVVLADVIDDSQLLDAPAPQKPIIVGSAAVDFYRPTRGSNSSAGKAAALRAALQENTDTGEPVDDTDVKGSRHIGAKLGVLGVLLLLVAGLIFGGYTWTQSQYYVATSDGKVAIYQGIPQKIGSLHLSHVVRTTSIKVSELPPVTQERLKTPITRTSLREAEKVVENIDDTWVQLGTPSSSPSPLPSLTTATPSPSSVSLYTTSPAETPSSSRGDR